MDTNEIINDLWYDRWYQKVCTDTDLHDQYEWELEVNDELNCSFDEWFEGESTIVNLAEGMREIIIRMYDSCETIEDDFDELCNIQNQLEENFEISKWDFLEYQMTILRSLTKRV